MPAGCIAVTMQMRQLEAFAGESFAYASSWRGDFPKWIGIHATGSSRHLPKALSHMGAIRDRDIGLSASLDETALGLVVLSDIESSHWVKKRRYVNAACTLDLKRTLLSCYACQLCRSTAISLAAAAVTELRQTKVVETRASPCPSIANLLLSSSFLRRYTRV